MTKKGAPMGVAAFPSNFNKCCYASRSLQKALEGPRAFPKVAQEARTEAKTDPWVPTRGRQHRCWGPSEAVSEGSVNGA